MIDQIRIRPASFTRRLTTTLSAMALALAGMTAAAVPARANNDDLVKFLMGATAVVIIGSALANSGRATPHRPEPVVTPRRPHVAPVLPASCAISISGNTARYYGERCLRQSGVRAQLPARCERTLRTNRGQRTVYDGQCMVNAGFRVETGRGHDDRRRDDRHRRW